MRLLFTRPVIWRDCDSDRRRFGFVTWLSGCELHTGRRVYRVRWSVR